MAHRVGDAVVPRAPWLVRARLLGRLATIGDVGLGVVIAPVGMGKTTLLRQWADTREQPVTWYAADRLPSEQIVRRDVARRPGGVVVDDVHRVSDPALVGRLAGLVEDLAREMPVVLASRHLPRLNLARDEVPRMVTVTATDLEFLPWEVAQLFTHVFEDPLDPTIVEGVTERTAGWAAALRLWHLGRSLGQGPVGGVTEGSRTSAASELPGCLREYLDREVLAGVPDSLVRFARITSVFDVVTPDRADRLLGTSGSHRTLAELARLVQFVVPDPDGDSYRFHRVLREHLRSGLVAEHGLTTTRRLFEAAGRVLQDEGAWAESFRARCRAGRDDAATELLAAHGGLVLRGSCDVPALLAGAFAASAPTLLFALAQVLLEDGAPIRAATVADVAMACGPSPEDIRRWGGLVDLAAQRHTGDAHTAARPGLLADVPDPHDPAWHAYRSLQLLASGRAADARTELALARSLVSAENPWVLAARLGVAAAAALVHPDDPAPELAQIYRLARELGLTWLARIAHAVSLVRHGQPRECAEGRRLATSRSHVGDDWGALFIDAAVAVALLRRGRPDLELGEAIAERCRSLGAGHLEAAARALQALAAAQSDLPDAGEAVAAEAFARRADAPAALAVAYSALAERRPEHRRDLIRLAASTSAASGLGCRPWTWRRDIAGRAERVWSRTAAATTGATVPTAAGVGRHTVVEPDRDLAMCCLGEFRVTQGGRPVALSSIRPVARTVLRILAVHAGTPVHRDVVIGALWGEQREAAALHNLHVAVSSLRHLLDELLPGDARSVLTRTGHAYSLAPTGPPLTDLQTLDRWLDTATRCRLSGDPTGQAQALRAVLDAYVADVLPADGSAEWVLPVRDRYREAVATAATTLAEVELRRGHPDAAVAAATRGVRIDPWRDPTWRVLIAAHEADGAPAAASRARQEYAAILESLGVSTVPAAPRQATAPAPALPAEAKRARPGGVRTA